MGKPFFRWGRSLQLPQWVGWVEFRFISKIFELLLSLSPTTADHSGWTHLNCWFCSFASARWMIGIFIWYLKARILSTCPYWISVGWIVSRLDTVNSILREQPSLLYQLLHLVFHWVNLVLKIGVLFFQFRVQLHNRIKLKQVSNRKTLMLALEQRGLWIELGSICVMFKSDKLLHAIILIS